MSESIPADERGPRALKQLQARTADLCEVIPFTVEDDFHVSTKTLVAGGALLMDSFVTSLEYNRTAAHVARGFLDHYLVGLCLQGEMRFSSGRRKLTMRRGDICLIDMAQPNRTMLTQTGEGRMHLTSLALPRAMLAPKLAHPDSATATFVSGSDRRGLLLANQFAAIWQLERSDASSRAATVEAMVEVVADVVGRAPDARGDTERAERHLCLAMIKRYIEANLDTALLTADHLCSRFRISRASLYRLFEADGGLARYVQEQRLNRALKQLVSPLAQSKRLIDLAVDLQFSGDSTFIRAFRRRFGVTPGEIRELSETWFRERGNAFEPETPLHHLARR
jgi:AraC-like DNA-binding protein